METQIDKKTNIFLVDDNDIFADIVSSRLESNSVYNVESFPTGEDMLVKLTKHTPDIIILDYELDSVNGNSMNGSEILSLITKKRPNVPVIMLTAKRGIQKALHLMHSGVRDYIVRDNNLFDNLNKSLESFTEMSELKNEIVGLKEKTKNYFHHIYI
ncbi:MAG: response regulator [Bacteroidetes bacterium]|nr:response regulator [Bacteroidota bacterium]MBL7104137.1 response regulator [Bacteroidales bacterium]